MTRLECLGDKKRRHEENSFIRPFCCESRKITFLAVFLPPRRGLKLKLLKEENNLARVTQVLKMSHKLLCRAGRPAQVKASFSDQSVVNSSAGFAASEIRCSEWNCSPCRGDIAWAGCLPCLNGLFVLTLPRLRKRLPGDSSSHGNSYLAPN